MQCSFTSCAMRVPAPLSDRIRARIRNLAILVLLAASFATHAQERVRSVGYLRWQKMGHYEEVTSKGFVERFARGGVRRRQEP